MKIWMSYLLGQLEAFQPGYAFDISEKLAPKVTGVCVYRPEHTILRADTIYICLETFPAPGQDCPESAYFVVDSGAGAGHLPNRIELRQPPAEDELLDLLLCAINRYRDWLDQMIQLALDRASPQEFLDASAEIIENPILIQDASFSMIAMTKDASEADYPFFGFNGTLYPTPELILYGEREANVIKRFTVGNEGRGVIREHGGKREILYNVLHNREVRANVVCSISRAELTQGQFDLFRDFCHYFAYSLNILPLQPQSGNLAYFALQQLVQFGNEVAMRDLLCPKEGWRFMVGTLRLGATSQPMVSEYLATMQSVLPNSAVCLFQDRITVVMCVSDQDSDAVFCAYQYQRLSTLAEAMDGIFGLSYRLPSLSGLVHAVHQSQRALELPRLYRRLSEKDPTEPPYSRLRFYEFVAITDILENFFSDDKAEHYMIPNIALLLREDMQTGQNNHEILFHYLLTGKSLAATSEALHMHRSTVVYRLERMKEQFGLRFDFAPRNQLYLLCCIVCQLQKWRQEPESVELEPAAAEPPEAAP